MKEIEKYNFKECDKIVKRFAGQFQQAIDKWHHWDRKRIDTADECRKVLEQHAKVIERHAKKMYRQILRDKRTSFVQDHLNKLLGRAYITATPGTWLQHDSRPVNVKASVKLRWGIYGVHTVEMDVRLDGDVEAAVEWFASSAVEMSIGIVALERPLVDKRGRLSDRVVK